MNNYMPIILSFITGAMLTILPKFFRSRSETDHVMLELVKTLREELSRIRVDIDRHKVDYEKLQREYSDLTSKYNALKREFHELKNNQK